MARVNRKFVRFKLRCEVCFKAEQFWGNADGGVTLARSFLRKHVNCLATFNCRAAVPETDAAFNRTPTEEQQ